MYLIIFIFFSPLCFLIYFYLWRFCWIQKDWDWDEWWKWKKYTKWEIWNSNVIYIKTLQFPGSTKYYISYVKSWKWEAFHLGKVRFAASLLKVCHLPVHREMVIYNNKESITVVLCSTCRLLSLLLLIQQFDIEWH